MNFYKNLKNYKEMRNYCLRYRQPKLEIKEQLLSRDDDNVYKNRSFRYVREIILRKTHVCGQITAKIENFEILANKF